MALQPPAADFSDLALRIKEVAVMSLKRIGRRNTGEPYFGRHAANRFDDPSKCFGACCCGLQLDTAIAESVLHDALPEKGHFRIRQEEIETRYLVNGSAFRSKVFAQACKQLGIRHRFTRPYRPQTNGKAERFIQAALREWAYGFTYQHSSERKEALDQWNHHYNWHRPHQGIGGAAPMSRLNRSGNNLVTLPI